MHLTQFFVALVFSILAHYGALGAPSHGQVAQSFDQKDSQPPHTNDHSSGRGVPNRDVHVLSKKSDERVQQCWDDLFGPNATTDNSPLVADCEKLNQSLLGNSDWVIGWNQTWLLVQNGTCAFTVYNPNKAFVRIGNGDVIRVVEQMMSIYRSTYYSPEDRIEGKGMFTCNDIHVPNEANMKFWINNTETSVGRLAPSSPIDGDGPADTN
ncbi:hypothetical protein B0T16DRAFT_455802 [Cercophora newfieldiana]|uniref:Ecp2 effector protein-like domain-containing protein n=1 Tax=Cercophora newfieldiana TaxID=92897 RepID=A0AA40CRA2_9PEZI|nr:hypothetical protein B0T16DRAFT_455802 [Cercophora newfieldiana]